MGKNQTNKAGQVISKHYPIHAALHASSRIRKEMHKNETGVWKQFANVISQGEAQPLLNTDKEPNEYFTNFRPTHLVGNAKLTEMCMQRRKFDLNEDGLYEPKIEVTTMNIQNPLQSRFAEPIPTALARNKFVEPSPDTTHAFARRPAEGKSEYDLLIGDTPREIFSSPLEKNFKYTSIIINDANGIQEGLKKNLTEFLEPHMLISSATTLAQKILESTKKTTDFIYDEDVYNEPPFRTLDYTVHINNTNAQQSFEMDDGLFTVKLQRKIVLASINQQPRHGNSTYNIPLCEEITVMLYKFADFETTLLSQSLVIHAKLRLAKPITSDSSKTNTQQWHFFGNGAMTIHQVNTPPIRRNHSDLAAFMVGFVSGQLMNITSYDRPRKEAAVKFFHDLFLNAPSEYNIPYEKRGELKKTNAGQRVLDELYTKHTQLKKQNSQTQDAFQNQIDDYSIPEKTFLASQQLNTMLHITDNKSPRIKLFFVSFSFCMVVLSPGDNPSINTVFVGTLQMKPPKANFQKHQSEPVRLVNTARPPANTLTAGLGTKHTLPPLGTKYRSTLPPELEMELELL